MKTSKIIILILIFALMLITLTSCIPGDGAKDELNKAGFFSGFWHGLIAIFTLIRSIFVKGAPIYEQYNNGFWYNLGFFLAITGECGGGLHISLGGRKRKKERE